MALYQNKTFGDLINAVREELGVQTTDTTAVNRIKRDMNLVYQEVMGESSWQWMRGRATVQLLPYFSTGTATLTTFSATVTLSVSPGASRTGYKFSVDGYSEIYTVESHEADSTTLYLKDVWTGVNSSSVTFKIWNDKIALPTGCAEVIEVRHDHHSHPLEKMGDMEFRRMMSPAPRAEGKPLYFSTGETINPVAASSISGMPSPLTRTSDGVLKSIVFNAAIPSALVAKVTAGEPVKLRISKCGHPSYNGDTLIASISTTTLANDTLNFTGRADHTEAAVSDTALVVKALGAAPGYSAYRELLVHPSICSGRVTLNVDYTKEAQPLSDDTDEPIIPHLDRVVLVYGTLARAWRKRGDTANGDVNFSMFQNKLAKMQGKLQETLDKPRLKPASMYLGAKRNGRSGVGLGGGGGMPSGGGSMGAVVTGPANTVTVFGSNGEATGGGVTTTELSYLSGATSSIQDQLEDLQEIAAALDAVPEGDLLTVDADGMPETSGLASSSFSYLVGAEGLTTATLTDNTASAAVVASWAAASINTLFINYSIKREAAFESGILVITHDETSAAMAQGAVAAIGNVGAAFSVDVSDGLVRLKYTTTATGTDAALKYKLQKWHTS